MRRAYAVLEVGRCCHGLANRVDRTRATGNGQVPAVAATAWRLLSQRLNEARVSARREAAS